MTWEHLKWAGKQTVGCGFAKAVLKEIALLAKPSGECTIAIKDLVARLELSPRTIKRALVKLTSKGLIDRQRRTNARGFRAADQYTIQGATTCTNLVHPKCPTGPLANRPASHLGLGAPQAPPLSRRFSPKVVKPILTSLEEDRRFGSVWCCRPGDDLNDEVPA